MAAPSRLRNCVGSPRGKIYPGMNKAARSLVSVNMNTSIRSALLLVVGLVAASGLNAQRVVPNTIVTLFSGPYYTGERITLSGNEKIDDFNFTRFPSGRGANNRVSSIRVEGDVEVTLFLYREFSGEQITLNRSISRLSRISLRDEPETWDDNLSSITVRKPTAHQPQPIRHSPNFVGPVVRASAHSHPSYESSRRERQSETANIVRKAYLDILDREADSQGLYQYVGIVEDRGWTEDRLRKELRRSSEYRNVTIPKQITKAYREVLGREPDSAGKSFYTRQMINQGWTQSRVRDALHRSPEFAQRKSSLNQGVRLGTQTQLVGQYRGHRGIGG